MKRLLKRIGRQLLHPVLVRFDRMQHEIERNRMLMVQSRIREFQQIEQLSRLADAEFSVFSQWGEDGIIQYLISKVPIAAKIFVEFGVEDYQESNTRFLLVNNNWRGLVIDSDRQNVARIRSRKLYYLHDVTAECAFVTRDNINSIIEKAGISGDIGLLSIDIDGNEYWIWRAISVIAPRIVVVEYNGLYGNHRAVATPYSPAFARASAHYSHLYYGASLKAFCALAKSKDYMFAGVNSVGTNAFFVRKDVSGRLAAGDCETDFVEPAVRDSRDRSGNLSFVRGSERTRLIEDEIVYDLETEKTIRIRDLYT